VAENKTDYTKPRMDLVDLLPEPLRSDANLSIFNNIFNRYMTKQEIEKVSGYIGRGNPSALQSRRINESTVHRQAFQLQPIPYNKIGSIEHMASWKDIQGELKRLGVDMSDFAEWGKTQKFNWVPPIDINKIVNYRDYYWVDDNNTLPQYITVRNTCSTATARLNFWEGVIQQFGSTFPISDILEIDGTSSLPTYSITNFTASPPTITIQGDATEDIKFGDFVDVKDSTSNDQTYQINSIPAYDGSTNSTNLSANLPIVAGTPVANARVALRRFDKIVILPNSTVTSGDYTTLFIEGFVFFLRNSPNVELNNSFLKTISSSYDPIKKETTVTIEQVSTDNTSGGELSLEEQLSLFEADKACQCGETGGWDTALWDDNPAVPFLWGDDEDAAGGSPPDGISDYTNLIDRISHPTPPTGVGVHEELWYDTLNNILYQYSSISGWVAIWNNFSLILDRVDGTTFWDFNAECDTRPRVDALEQWMSENKWLHKNDVVNFTNSLRAAQPIIEYDWDLELNEWTYTSYNWSYRTEADKTFKATTSEPPRIELEPLIWWENEDAVLTNTTIIFDDRYGDMTDYFAEGKGVFVTTTTKQAYFVDYSEYKASPTGFPYRTYVTFTSRPTSTGNLSAGIPNTVTITPINTINGDEWQDYGSHWMLSGLNDSLPSPHQSINGFIEIDENATFITDVNYDYTTSLYAERFITTTTSVQDFVLSTTVPSNSTRSLSRMALFGHDDIRVYLSDIAGLSPVREFGTYREIGEAVFDIVNIDYVGNEFIIAGNDPVLLGRDLSSYFNTGDTILVADISGITPTTYVVDSFSNNNRIKVTTPIIASVAIDGNISNVTNPVPDADFVNSKNVTIYVSGIHFFNPITDNIGVNVIVGESSVDEIGNGIRKVRTIADNDAFNVSGNKAVSNIKYRIVEQVKTEVNQYPIFDIFSVEGKPTFKANAIFGYKTDSAETINIATRLRIVHDEVNDIYGFDQFLLEKDNGELFAYRDYANKQGDYWYNNETNELKFWDNIRWNDKTMMSEHYRKAVISDVEPELRLRNIDGLYWYNTTSDKLFKRFLVGPSWIEITNVDKSVTDVNLQTIWKAGTNDDLYIPSEVDWIRRTQEDYNTERDEFIVPRIAEIIAANPSVTVPEATIQATEEWFQSQANPLSENGSWVGDWEIPDPLYFNNLHENKKYLTSRELLTHFTTIIDSQPNLPGFTGSKTGLYNLTPINDTNLALGGTIKEFNNGFDIFVSSVFVDNVTPRSLIEFAHDQYESLLNIIKELYRKNAVDVLSDMSVDNILNIADLTADKIIKIYEQNDNAAFVYGDTTTFTDVDGINDLGVRNWIATLPYLKLVNKILPERLIDNTIGLNEVVHHDGHRNSYSITQATGDIISKVLIAQDDPRATNGTLGYQSTSSPANTITEFTNAFSNITGREGVYWYHTTTQNILYRYVVVASGITQPITDYTDGTLWMDLTPSLEVLRIKSTDSSGNVTWDIVDGLVQGDGKLHNGTDPLDTTTATVSAWQVIDFDILLGDIIFNLENRLYDNSPTPRSLNYNFVETAENRPVRYLKYLNESFLDFISQSEIEDPLKNTLFDAIDPFTWNYKKSAGGGAITILEADSATDSFLLAGDHRTIFDPCIAVSSCPSIVTFYIKNSTKNNGTWKTIESTPSRPATSYDGTTTRIFVDSPVEDDLHGSIHFQKLPSPQTDALPNNLNDGSESGGDWRGIYKKFYGTPFPHLEPWVLQGYTSRPTWWDSEYKNNDEQRWGKRKWKYKHGFQIMEADNVNDFFSISGDFNDILISNTQVVVDNSLVHQGTYGIKPLDTLVSIIPATAGAAGFVVDNTSGFAGTTYTIGMRLSIATGSTIKQTYIVKNVNLIANIATIIVEEEILVGDLTSTTDFINGALYTPATNRTSIYIDTPTISSNVIEGRIAISVISVGYGMWENIRTGKIPVGATYPNEVVAITGIPTTDRNIYGLSTPDLPSFSYFSVNIDNLSVSSDGGTTSYGPDEILPPFWDHTVPFTTTPSPLDRLIRTIFFDFSTEIISPNADYLFGDSGNIEWEWRESSQFLYDQLVVAYRLDPINFIYKSFGFNFTNIGGLLVDRDNKNTASHTRTNFHGDIINGKQYKSDGLNQWYVNFNRFEGYDANFSDFQSLWTLWTAPLTYQFSSYIDTPSFNIAHRFIDITDFDAVVTSKRSPGVEDFWLDAFDIQILDVPFDISRYDNQLDWRFEIKTNITQSRDIAYYDVHNYQFYADPTTNECKLYTWDVLDLDTLDNTFTIYGNQSSIFVNSRLLEVSGSSGNDGTYTISSSAFNGATNTTIIEVEDAIFSPFKDGTITLSYRSLPWETGFGVYLTTSELLPIPLVGDTVNGITKFFVIKTSDNTFKLAETQTDAFAGNEFDITTQGVGDHFVGEVLNTFNVEESGDINWRQYALDKNNILTWFTPTQVQGMQPWIDIVRGYDAYIKDVGWIINEDRTLRDPDTGIAITWQIEIERFIKYAYSTRTRRNSINDRYAVTVDATSNEFTFVEDNNVFITGDQIIVLTSNSIYPSPLARNIRYFVIRDTLDTFRLAASRVDALNGDAIDILPTAGVGNISILTPTEGQHLIPSFEMNPFRNAVWFNQPSGIVSDVIAGPVADIRTTQLIFDQNGNNVNLDQLLVYRADKQTKFIIKDAINTDPEITFTDINYNLLHLGGMHIFVDEYEHVLKFNDYSAGGNLLYDPFIGLNVTKYEMLFNRNPDFTGRPNIGGYYLETFFNQGANIKENFEAGVENLRKAYDTYDNLETNIITKNSRDSLGYNGATEYLSNLNMTEKSQFIFWRGQIQSKGSVNAVNAYINSRRFIDAKIDEFWAIKVAEFGSVEEKEYPEMFTTTVDARSNEFKIEFINNDDLGLNVDDDFIPIRMSDEDRWYNQPDQLEVLRNNGKVMYFDMKIVNSILGTTLTVIDNNTMEYIIHGMDVDAIEMTLDGTELVEGTDFNYINPYVVELTNPSIRPNLSKLIIWGYVANNDAQNPSRLIDRESEVQLSPIEFWDPARGNHYSNAIHNVDLENYNDPAVYDVATTPQTITSTNIWSVDKVGTTWMDTSTMSYIPYNSAKVIEDNFVRFREWGQLHYFASVNVYEWVESDVPPVEWDAIAETEEGDNTIPEIERKSGRAKFTLFEPDPVFPGEWIPLKDKIDVQYAASDGVISTATTRIFIPDLNIIDNTKTLDVYINEVKQPQIPLIGSPGILPNTVTLTVKENDVVKFVQSVPTDINFIAAEITAGNLLQEYEYTTIQKIDRLGVTTNTYYFWVSNKTTKASDKNRTMSPIEAQQQLVNIPNAHMFFQKPTLPKIVVETGNLIERAELNPTVVASPANTYMLDFVIAPDTIVNVDINGADVAQDDLVYVADGTSNLVIINVPILTSSPADEIEIMYVGLYDNSTVLPNRFTQVIIRGLQGLVFDDSRYTIRYTRDFTLRDNLEIENKSIDNMELKNLHEEWKIFRREQSSNVDRWQWDRITESMIGYKLNSPAVRVPSFERELYDEKHGTDTQYGLGTGQAFVNGSLALTSILSYLVDPGVDFTPIDINSFFTLHNFDTTEAIISSMETIYTSFKVTDVNRIYFSVLHDAFTTKSKYHGIFKTSMVSLHGIRPLQTSGVFDD